MAQITISGISGGTPPYTIKVYKVGDPTPVYTGTTSSTSFTATFSQPINADYYATIENGVCTAYQSSNQYLFCNCNKTSTSFYNIKAYSITNPFSSLLEARTQSCSVNTLNGKTCIIEPNYSVGSRVYTEPCSNTDCATLLQGFWLSRFHANDFCTNGSQAIPPSCGDIIETDSFGNIVQIIPLDCTSSFELLESAIGNCDPTYTVTVSDTGLNSNYFFIVYGWSTVDDYTTVTNWQASDTFTVDADNVTRYFFVQYAGKDCATLTAKAGESTRNC